MYDRKFSTTGFVLKASALVIIALCILILIMKGKDNTTGKGYIGKAEVTTDGHMTPELMLTLGKVSAPVLSPDNEYILYNVTYTSIEENRSCSNLFICKSDGSDSMQLTREGSSIRNAVWSGDGKRILFIQDGQIYSAPLKKKHHGWRLGKKTRLSDVSGGVSEFSLSPDGSRIMYSASVKGHTVSPSDIYSDLDKADAISTEDLMYRHWDHWTKEIPHTFICRLDPEEENCITMEASTDILGTEGKDYELPAEPFSGIEQLCWSPDGRYIAYSCKKLSGKAYAFSTDSEIYIYDTVSGNTMQIPVKGGYDTTPVWSPDGSMICWIRMERNGYEADRQRLMVAYVDLSREGDGWLKGIEEISSGFRYNVSSPVWDGNDRIYFNALAEGVQGIFLARTSDVRSHEGGWAIERITGEDLWYDFNSPFAVLHADDRTTLLASWCSMDFPTELVAVDINADKPADGRTVSDPALDEAVHSDALPADCPMADADVTYRYLTRENTELLSKFRTPYTEARHIETVDGKKMLTWVIFPPDFNFNGNNKDSCKVYPAIEICLGGPQGTLSQGWSYRWNYRLMAEQGYVVVLPNRRGTTAFGPEWTEEISGDYCGLNMQDYLSAARAVKAEPYIGKIAACGASYGGYSVYNLCGIHDNTFSAFIAHAGIFNQEHMYMTTEEMWFPNWDNGGTPEECSFSYTSDGRWPTGPAGDGETFGGVRQGGSPWSDRPAAVRHYANSPHRKVTKWNTPLLVTHGGMDFRVPVDQGMAAYNAAQLMGVPSRLIVFPEENHWILKPQNALMWQREYFAWLDRWCRH